MSSTQDMNKYKANRKYLLELHDKKTEIDELYQPIKWFDIKHDYETPGLMNNIKPNKISPRSWKLQHVKWCILDARNQCVQMFNTSKKMPYFAIFKNKLNMMQWAIFQISDNDFNAQSDKSGKYSSIELEENGLEMNVNFQDKKNKPLVFTDKNSIYVPSNYTIDSGKISCIKKVPKEVSNCNAILQEKRYKCDVAKTSAIAANEKETQYKLLGEVDNLIDGMTNVETFTSLNNASEELNKNIIAYSKSGDRSIKKKITESRKEKRQINHKINEILGRSMKFPLTVNAWNVIKQKRNNVTQKSNKVLTKYRRGLINTRNTNNYLVRRHSNSASIARQTKMHNTTKKKCAKLKSGMKYYREKRNYRWNVFAKPKVKCGFVGSINSEIFGYQPKNTLSGSDLYDEEDKYANDDESDNDNSDNDNSDNDNEGFRWSRKKKKSRRRMSLSRFRKRFIKKLRRNIPPVLLKRQTQKSTNHYNNLSGIFNKLANNARASYITHVRQKKTAARTARIANNELRRSFQQGFANNIEGFDNSVDDCNNLLTDPKFTISHDNAIHNCINKSVYSKYSSVNHKHTISVPENKTFVLTGGLLDPSKITSSLFVSDVGDCNNGVDVTEQKIDLFYSLNHEKENIVIVHLSIDDSSTSRKGIGMLTYNYAPNNSGPHPYVISNKSNNNNETNVRLDGNGNVKINKTVIFRNPLSSQTRRYLMNGYNNTNNLQQIKPGEELRNAKYKFTLGSSWNNSTLFYKTRNVNGNNGFNDLHGLRFKYTESYHKNKGSTDTNVFILYKIRTHELKELLYEHRIYANIETVDIAQCNTGKGLNNLCFVRAIKDKLVGDEKINERENVNFKTVKTVTMSEFTKNIHYKTKYINNNILTSVPNNINEIRIFLIKSLNDIHSKISMTMKSGASEGFMGYDNAFSRYSTIEGLELDASGGHIFGESDGDGVKNYVGLLDNMNKQDKRINNKTNDMKTQANAIRSKLQILTGYDGGIHRDQVYGGQNYSEITKTYKNTSKPTPLLNTHDDYDNANTLIPFIYDKSVTSTDFYNTANDKLDPKAKIDAVRDDLNEMLYQQHTLYTIGSITSATFIIAAILLARSSGP